MISKTEKFWDMQAQKYDSAEKQFDPVYSQVIIKIRKYLEITDNILDFGCATGTKTIELSKGIKHIHGLDISTEMINIAGRKKEEAGIMNISFSKGTLINDRFEEASFDKIIAFGIIHLLERGERAIQRIHELLKPGGLFFSTTACLKDKMDLKNAIEFRVSLLLKKLGVFPLHLNMYMPDDIEKLIESQNFQIVEAEKMFHGITASFIVARKIEQ